MNIYIESEHFTGAILRQIEAPKSAIFHLPVKCSVADNGVKVGNMKEIPLSHGEAQYKGVYLNGRNWGSRITVNKNKIHLGTFLTEEVAADVYDGAAMFYFGEFACLNNASTKEKL